ncbi:MFS transporter [Dyella nitratireducens]|uniref:MFS transporter n=1 Tax=Dyella nitratireducens TaxID=1849580 RepID=A0ABQ1FN44_9GAMM|nr:MFS transporter [Dyella nitratireducens]GGA22972.1 MFS transporter [Dyella nitratireducens]GLQ44040.1 MFS transporter [Dyella nitratireducens]
MNNAVASPAPVRLFAVATAVIVLSLYQAQPLIGMMTRSLHLTPAVAGLISTLTLLGYACGLFLLVPLCDVCENRSLVLATLFANALTLLLAACPIPAAAFLVASGLTGFTATAIQMLIPMAAAMVPEAQRGRVIGNVMSGLILGVLLSRPLASVVAGRFGWRMSYWVLAAAVGVLTLLLAKMLPRRSPPHAGRYVALLSSMAGLLREEPVLRRRAFAAALCFAAFNAFWSTVVLRLSSAPFGLSADGVAIYALVGVSGALAAPFAGRLGDRGFDRIGTHAARMAVVLAMALAWIGGVLTTHLSPALSLSLLVMAAILLDAGTIADQALGRRAVNLLRPEARGRINALFTGIFFMGGALGSALAGVVWARAGWHGVCLEAIAFAVAALVYGMRRHSTAVLLATEDS